MMRRLLPAVSRRNGLAVIARAASSSTSASVMDGLTQRKPHHYEQFVSAANEEWLAELQQRFKEDRTQVDSSWWPVLEALDSTAQMPDVPLLKAFSRPKGGSPVSEADEKRIDSLKLAFLVRSFEHKGHLVADLDPLGMFDADLSPNVPPELQPAFFGFTEAELDKTFRVSRSADVIGTFTDGPNTVALREVVEELNATYCKHIGYEFSHLRSVEEQAFLRKLAMQPPTPMLSQEQLLAALIESEGFERLLHAKFQTMKRFGSEGGEAKVPMLQVLLAELATAGIDNAIFSMAHRGRLNILHNVLGKRMELILNEFKGYTTPENRNNLGDVKYHLGHEADIRTINEKPLSVKMLPNPSHLECAAPVAQGWVRAMQDSGSPNSAHIVLHGDAAFSGQGVSYETVATAELQHFSINGTVHIISNNQVGFTTNPAQSRSAAYCSDLAKLNNCPVFHVNADRPEAVQRVAQMAAAYRAQFKKDVIIDFVCYRRNGHNEADQPRYTQPLMYKAIDAHDSVGTVYAKQLLQQGAITEQKIAELRKASDARYRDLYKTWEARLGTEFVPKKWHDPVNPPYEETDDRKARGQTGLPVEQLQALGAHLTAVPSGFTVHKIIAPVLRKRAQSIAEGKEVEWATAEQLALGSLVQQGHGVRLSGQDVERGTYSQRHYNLHDAENGATHLSLLSVPDAKDVPVSIGNSLLSEFAVAGFEMGYSSRRLDDLVMWEAQFGDFANGAQVIWDNFLSGSEIKWDMKSNLIVSLPHGYDGQGPEHSSSRLERFLQLEGSDDVVPTDFETAGVSPYHALETRTKNGNWQVCFTTTSANYFHVLRRQMRRDFRKPLIHLFSKSNLRAEESKCSLDQFGEGTQFQPVIDQHHITKARRVLLCSGQVYNTLVREQLRGDHTDVAIVRLEQIAPFPWEQLALVLDKYRASNSNVEVAWVQDEPRNMGAWPYVRPRLRNLLVQRGVALKDAAATPYIGREANGSPATGYEFIHVAETKTILEKSFA